MATMTPLTPLARLSDLSCAAPNDRFPSYLKHEYTLLRWLSLNAIPFTPGEFAPFLNPGHFLPGLQGLTYLTLKNMPDVPRIILASCPRLRKLVIENVHILDDASSIVPVQRAQLEELECSDIDEHTFAQLVSVVDVTRLTASSCELACQGSTLEGRNDDPRGMQRVLHLCRRSLQFITLTSSTCSTDPRPLYTLLDIYNLSSTQNWHCSR